MKTMFEKLSQLNEQEILSCCFETSDELLLGYSTGCHIIKSSKLMMEFPEMYDTHQEYTIIRESADNVNLALIEDANIKAVIGAQEIAYLGQGWYVVIKNGFLFVINLSCEANTNAIWKGITKFLSGFLKKGWWNKIMFYFSDNELSKTTLNARQQEYWKKYRGILSRAGASFDIDLYYDYYLRTSKEE